MLAHSDVPGRGPGLVLMHGLGADRRSLEPLVCRLAGTRAVTVDLRGHGQSTTAPWSFAAAVQDLAAVIAAAGLDRPFVGGHSLGGMVALQYGLAGHPVAGVINVDGWGPGVAPRFVGEEPAAVETWLARVADGAVPGGVAGWLLGRSRQAREGTTAEVLRSLAGADLVQWHREAPVPSLAFNALSPASRATRLLMGAQATRLERAHRVGLRRDLASLTAQRPDVRVREVHGTHQLVRSHPDLVAREIAAFMSCGTTDGNPVLADDRRA